MILLFLQTMMDTTTLATLAAGVIAPFITQLVKTRLGMDSLAAYALHVVVSAGLAVGALWLNGELNTTSLRANVPLVLAIATTVFQFIKGKTQPTPVE